MEIHVDYNSFFMKKEMIISIDIDLTQYTNIFDAHKSYL